MMKMNFTDNQVAFDYAVYMIVGSYFSKAKCTNPLLERGMRLQYCEQKLNDQYHMEDICIRYVEKELLKILPSRFWENEMQVRILPQSVGGSEIQFLGPDFILRVRGSYSGKKSRIFHELWMKERGESSGDEGHRSSRCFINLAPRARVRVQKEKH